LQAATPPRARRSPLPHRGDQSRAWGSRALWRCEWRGSTSRPGSRSPAAQPDPQDRTQRLGSYTDLTLSSAALLVVHAEPVVCISTPAHSLQVCISFRLTTQPRRRVPCKRCGSSLLARKAS
jgi:hypothetical protein